LQYADTVYALRQFDSLATKLELVNQEQTAKRKSQYKYENK